MENGKVFLALVAGAAVGAALGVLFAKDSGDETRDKISKKMDDMTDSLSRRGKEVLKDLKETLAV